MNKWDKVMNVYISFCFFATGCIANIFKPELPDDLWVYCLLIAIYFKIPYRDEE